MSNARPLLSFPNLLLTPKVTAAKSANVLSIPSLGWFIQGHAKLNFLSLSGVQPNPPAENPAETLAEQGVVEADEKKKRRGRKKSKLEDMFPAYLQVRAF